MNMFKPIQATTVKEYLDSVPEERKEIIHTLHDFIRQTVPKLKPHIAYNMLGYGSFPYKNYKKEMIQWPVIALANQKHYVSIYVCAIDKGEYLAEKYKSRLGKVSVGKSCIRFKKLENIHLSALGEMINKAALNPGLIAVKNSKKKEAL